MRMIFLINPGTDNSKAGTLPYDLLAFPFQSQKFNPKILTPKSPKRFHCYFNIFIPPAVVQGGGRGLNGTPPRSFRYVAVFRNDFTFNEKPLIFLTR